MTVPSQRWGKPVERDRRFEAIEESHRSRLAHTAAAGSLDQRTWDDLNMDAVFAALDRTESTVGQHALYHRLRTVPVGPHLDAFEALTTRMTTDAPIVNERNVRFCDWPILMATTCGGWRAATRSKPARGTCCSRCLRLQPSCRPRLLRSGRSSSPA